MKNPYEDLIGLPHHVSVVHPPMSMNDRAAQFAPFSALNGYENAIRETGRITEEKAERSEDACERLNRDLQLLLEQPEGTAEADFLYFVPDAHKEGGKYRTLSGTVRRVDLAARVILMQDGTKIPLEDILEIRVRMTD